MHTIRIVSTVIMAMVLMASCDPPVSKPATTTTADDATTATAADTVVAEDQPVPPTDPAEIAAAKAASVEAAKAVQIVVKTIRRRVTNVEELYNDFNFRILNAVQNGNPRSAIRSAKGELQWAKTKLDDAAETGLKMLSQKAVEAAKAVVALESSAKADEAVAKAVAVKAAVDKTDRPSVQFAINAAINEVDTGTDLTADMHAEDWTAIRAAKTQVDDLKKLAGDAVAAAEAVVAAEVVQ